MAKLAQAPFLKVEATKFTEVGYVGRDVESIVRDLVEVSITMLKETSRKGVQAKAELQAEDKLVTALVGEGAGGDTRAKFRKMLREGELEQKEVDVQVSDTGGSPIGQIDLPGVPPGQMINLGEMMRGMMGKQQKTRRMSVADARSALTRDEADHLLDTEQVTKDAVFHAEQNGIVFLDEIDKVCARSSEGGFRGGDVSREGVQRDLLPLIEGTTVSTKYGPVKTDHILFIASGCVSSGQAVRPAARTAGAAADPGGAGAAFAGRSAADPGRAGTQFAEAICGADADGGRDAGVPRGCRGRAGRSGGRHQ